MEERCPICKKPVQADNSYRPFCSRHCQMIDLGRWVKEDYCIAGEKTFPDDLDAYMPDEDED